jgi:hypothetical protein
MPHIIIETSKNILASESLKIGQEIQLNNKFGFVARVK